VLSENITENIKISAKERLGCYESKKHKPWFDERFWKLQGVRIKGIQNKMIIS
jgi:hypothetical protein